METLSDKLWREYINGYKEEIKYMDDVEGFIKDNTIQKGTCLEKVLGSHIMYRVNLHTDNNLLSVKGENKRYKYEFLVEFDTNTPEYGIYYGCRAVIEPGFNDENLKKQRELIDTDWEKIKDEVKKVLSNVFVDKQFSDRTFRKTNNINDNCYWPFWIALGDEENVVEVAARATLLIANFYSLKYGQEEKSVFETVDIIKFVENNLIENMPAKSEEYIDTTTKFTIEAFCKILMELKEDKKSKFLTFINLAESNGYIHRNKNYELCWDVVDVVKGKKIKDFAATFRYLCEDELKYRHPRWEWADRLFTSELKGNDRNPTKKGEIIDEILPERRKNHKKNSSFLKL